MIEQIVLIVHVIVAVVIVGAILLQQGKGSDMGASFGAGSSQTVFGVQGGGSLLTKWTALLVAIFLVTSLSLAYFAHKKSESLYDVMIDQEAVEASFALPVKEGEVGASDDVPAATNSESVKSEDVPQ